MGAVERLEHLFATDGLLVKTVGGWLGSDWEDKLRSAQTLDQVPVDTDCGAWCAAFSFLHAQLPVAVYDPSGSGLLFDAHDDLWRFVQCLAPTDSNAASRSCCACFEPKNCPFQLIDPHNSGYCQTPCAEQDDTCKLLAAGCGYNLRDLGNFDFVAEYRGCSSSEVRDGSCELCKQPAWCIDSSWPSPYGGPISPREWSERFTNHGAQLHGCKFKREQKSEFIEASRAHYARRGSECCDWNKVTMYVGPHDGGLQAALMRSLVGLVDFHGDGARLRGIQQHLLRLGLREVPVFSLHQGLWHWMRDATVQLSGTPYQLVQRY